MELVNEFTVNRPISETWEVLTNVERIVPCLPGAQLTKVDGEIYHATVRIKVGPIAAAFRGQANFVELNSEKFYLELKAAGRDASGKGSAAATITAQLEEVSENVTHCVVNTDLSITGKVAQFGRGAMEDISGKIISQFASNLNSMIESESQDIDTTPVSAGTPLDTPAQHEESTEVPRVRLIESPVSAPFKVINSKWADVLEAKWVQVVAVIAAMAVVGILARRTAKN